MQLEPRTYRNFNGGVNTAMAPDNLASSVSPWGRNSVLDLISGDTAVPACRAGFRVLNQTAIPDSPSILRIVGFNHIANTTGIVTPYLIAVSGTHDSSRVDTVSTINGTLTPILSLAAAPELFTSYLTIPSATVAQNAVYVCDGATNDRRKILLNGFTPAPALYWAPWGMETPDITGLTVTAGGSGVMDGDYEISVSYRNEDSGAVSNRSASVAVTATGGESIVVNWAAVSTLPPEATHIKIHIRKLDLTSLFFEAVDAPTTRGRGLTDEVTLNLSVAQLNQLIILSPGTTDHSRPPAQIRGSAWHVSRMFVFDDTNLYWSNLGAPEEFNPSASQPINPKDGGKIITILQVHDSLLLILKSNGVWGLFGTAPEDWELRVIAPGIGCAAPHSAQVLDGKVLWWSEDGPMLWSQQGPPIPIGRDLLGDVTGASVIDPAHLSQLCSVVDAKAHRVWWSATVHNTSQNSLIFPFNTRLGVWESHEWDPFEVSALGVGVDPDGITWVYAGSPYGRLFEYGSSPYDGARTSNGGGTTLTITGSPTSSTSSTLVDTAATFDTDGAGLEGLNVVVVDLLTRTSMRRTIVSNTATELTVSPVWSQGVSLTSRYFIGSPLFEWDTRWEDWDQPFVKKRFTRLYAQVGLASSLAADVDFEVYTRLDPFLIQKTITLAGTGQAGYWDMTSWDACYFGQASVNDLRSWVGRTGRSLRIRVRCFESTVGMSLLKLGLEAVTMSGRR